MFFAKPGEFEPCGIFTFRHFILLIATALVISVAVKYTRIKKKEDITKIIRVSTIVIWVLEILKIAYTISVDDGYKINNIVPLYYCSLLLYTGVLSSVGKGVIKRIGDVFLATGGIIAGIVFLFFPTTSLPAYPMLHFISIHSFFYHGMMIYLGLLMNKYKYIELKKSDIKYYAGLILIICVLAYIVNCNTGSNLMFISEDFPGTPLTYIYHVTGRFFTVVMCLIQMTLPFYVVYGLYKLQNKKNKILLLKGMEN